MKKLFFLFAVVLVSKVSFGQATNTITEARTDVAVASFDSQTYDFGKIKQGTPVTHEFKFTNTGKVPMIITNVQASCGCTTPDYSKDPVPPGGQGFIKATFNAAAIGNFNKSITITSNVESGYTQLIIRGEVVDQVQ
jgi:hypothetical protein